jgi:hypothetical protein
MSSTAFLAMSPYSVRLRCVNAAPIIVNTSPKGGQRRQPGQDPRQSRQHNPDRPQDLQRADETQRSLREVLHPRYMFAASFSLGCESFIVPAPRNAMASST